MNVPAKRGNAPPTIQELLSSPGTVKRFEAVIPKHMTPDRLIRIALQAVWRTPRLAEADPMTLLGAFTTCGILGLEPNTPLGHVYVLPYRNRRQNRTEVNVIIGKNGYIDLARRSGQLVNLHADVIYDADHFEYEYGTDARLIHRPELREERGKWYAAYAHMKLKDGEGFRVLGMPEIRKAKAASQSKDNGPWVTHEPEMAAKTAIRRLAPYMPQSLELANALVLDERKADFRQVLDASSSDLKNLDATAIVSDDEPDDVPAIDHETGEVVEFDPQTGEVDDRAPVEAQQESKPQQRAKLPEARGRQRQDAPPAEDGDPGPGSALFGGE